MTGLLEPRVQDQLDPIRRSIVGEQRREKEKKGKKADNKEEKKVTLTAPGAGIAAIFFLFLGIYHINSSHVAESHMNFMIIVAIPGCQFDSI